MEGITAAEDSHWGSNDIEQGRGLVIHNPLRRRDPVSRFQDGRPGASASAQGICKPYIMIFEISLVDPGRCCIKADLRKAFDSVRWDYLHEVVIQDIFGIPSYDLPVKYLGLPLLAGNLSNAACAPLVDKVQRRLQTWTGLYLKKENLWNLSPVSSSSSLWRRILSSKSWVRPLTRFIIFEGHSINIWDDPWLQGYRLRHHFHNQALLSWGPIDQAKVSLFIKDGRWVKPDRWRPIEFNDVWNSIIEMDIGGSGPDILIWIDHKTGQITTPAAWNHVRKHHPPLVWTSEVWNSIQPPRYSFLLWQAALNRLPTKDRLWKRQTIWLIWKARNEKIFKGSITPKKKLVYQIIHSAKFRFSGEVIEDM
ncbi:hypothetical protein QJS10_CPA09g00507 [Acorus calamus]|uniref:Reverse transcriptase zinc-binding domain-containing protein n=1 Tax=Acorus calamus TaxID=4465 RepID=A0AAV9E500_ACOCL|nr:hypothetical protein QJS10_CPA09g00507 [Acorus calamus]